MNSSATLKEKLNNIPQLPGIYKMLDAQGNIIYIGKSKCLKKRVRSYFTRNHKWSKIEKLVSLIHDIDYTVTDTHLEARLLECKLIKENKPVFNAQMKNDRGYVYLKVVDKYNQFKVLTIESQRGEYTYGPFRQRYKLYDIINLLMGILPITKKEDDYLFDYHAIPLPIDQATFHENREILIELFSNIKNRLALVKALEDKMEEAASLYKYETASKYRDIIQGLNYIDYRISDYYNFVSQDFLLRIPTTYGTKLFLISNGMILSSKNFQGITNIDIDTFINRGFSLRSSIPVDKDEKAAIDYHDIIYTEIKSLPEGSYEVLSSLSESIPSCSGHTELRIEP